MPTPYFALLTLIQPFWAAVLFLFSSARLRPTKTQIVILVMIFSLLGIYWFPWGDAQVHFGIYYCNNTVLYANATYLRFFDTYDIVIKFIADLTGHYMWGYFFWIFVPWAFYASGIWGEVEKNNVKPYTLVLWTLILLIGIRELLDLNRNAASFLFFTAAMMQYPKSRWLSILLGSVALVLHSSCIGLFAVSLLCHFTIRNFNRKWYIIILVASLAFSLGMAAIIGMFVPEKFAEAYLSGKFGSGTGVDSGFFYLMTMTNIAMASVIGFFIIRNLHKVKRDFLFACYASSSILLLSTWMLWTMRERFMIANILLGFTVLIANWKYLDGNGKRGFRKMLWILIALAMAKIALVCGVEYSSEIVHHTGSKHPEKTLATVVSPLYMPTFMIVDIDTYGFNNTRLSSEFPIAKQFISIQ